MVKNMNNKKQITFFLTLIIIFLIPNITANTISNITVENEQVNISVGIYGTYGMQEKIVKLNQKDVHRLETIFDDMKTKLDNVNTNQETTEIFNEVVESLNELKLLPKDITVKEAQRLVTNINFNEKILGDDNENFNCFISGRTTYNEVFKEGWEIDFTRIKFVKTLVNGFISFGEEWWEYGGGSGDYYKAPASGWIWTKGSNGVITWEGDSLWGNQGSYYYMGGWPYLIWWEYWFYKGATGFTGIHIRGFPRAKGDYFFGFASHVSIVTEFPGKNLPIGMQKSHIGHHSSILFQQLLKLLPNAFPILRYIYGFNSVNIK